MMRRQGICIQQGRNFPKSGRMSAKPKRRGKMGRPPAGNKAFLIRMKPDTHADLLRAAEKDGYQRLGEWLDNVETPALYKRSNPARLKNPSPKLLSDAFLEYATEVARVLLEMRLIVERNPMLDQDEANLKALQNLRRQYDSLIRRMEDFGMEM